jgi:hypothetical protein
MSYGHDSTPHTRLISRYSGRRCRVRVAILLDGKELFPCGFHSDSPISIHIRRAARSLWLKIVFGCATVTIVTPMLPPLKCTERQVPISPWSLAMVFEAFSIKPLRYGIVYVCRRPFALLGSPRSALVHEL